MGLFAEDVSAGSVVGHTILDAPDSTYIPSVYVKWLLVKAVFILAIFLWLLTLGKLLTQSILWEDIPIQFGIIQHWIEIFAAEKKKDRCIWFYESPSASMQARTEIWAGIMKQLLVQCQLKDFFSMSDAFWIWRSEMEISLWSPRALMESLGNLFLEITFYLKLCCK